MDKITLSIGSLAQRSRVYLQQYDRFAAGVCVQAGAVYFRYADDQMILLNDPGKIENLLLLLTRNLDRFGLRINQKKVMLWRTSDLIENRCRVIQAIFADKGDNQKTALVRKFVDAYFALTLEQLAASWNGGMPLLNRLMWAKLESLPRGLFNKMMVRLTAEPFLLLATGQKLKRIGELNALRATPIDFNKRIRTIASKKVHNAFHHEARSYASEIGHASLKQFLDERIEELNLLMHSNVIE